MLYKNMKVITSRSTCTYDVEVEQGVITKIKRDIPGNGIDFGGRYVIPSVTDLHVHARDFSQAYKETVKTCTRAAAHGGITTIVDMPNTDPPVITEETFKKRIKLFERDSLCDFALNFGVVDTLEEMKRVHPFFVKVYLAETTGELLFKGDAQKLLETEIPVAIHSDLETTQKWCSFPHGILYICHIASKPEIEFSQSQNVIREVTPHHLFLKKNDDPLTRVKPVLGTEEDKKALWTHLKSIDIIASDHAPHTREEKIEGAYGIAGIETMLPLLLNAFNKGMLSLEDIALRLSENPCNLLNSLLNFKKGFFVGADADFTVIDLKREWVIKASQFYSKANHSPFDGWKIRGAVTETILRGNTIYEADTNS
jgi:dihydroorotase